MGVVPQKRQRPLLPSPSKVTIHTHHIGRCLNPLQMRKCMQIKAMYCTRHFFPSLLNSSLQLTCLAECLPRTNPEFFFGGWGDTEAIYNLRLILKIVLWKSCLKHNCNMTLFATALLSYKYNYMFRDSVTVTYLLVSLIMVFFKILMCLSSDDFSDWFHLKSNHVKLLKSKYLQNLCF